MALTGLVLTVVKQVLDKLDSVNPTERRILSLGYPDILVSTDTIAEIFGHQVANNVEFHPDSAAIIRWHGMQKNLSQVVESHHFFRLLGYELEVVDIVQARGNEILVDLNYPCPQNMQQRYALVIDSGTIEHCLNIGQAMINVASMVAPEGWLLHGNPLNMFNHGFYNLNPTLYHDFYLTNGFDINLFKVVHNAHQPKLYDVPMVERFSAMPEGCVNLFVAQRVKLVEMKYPVQTKYRNSPDLKG